MTEYYQSIMKNDVWEVVPKLEGKSVVSSKWIYKIKHSANGSIDLQSQICGPWILSHFPCKHILRNFAPQCTMRTHVQYISNSATDLCP